MQEEVRAEQLADVTVTMRPLSLTDEQLAALAALPNVAAIEPGIRVDTRVLVGERRAPALVIGVRNFARQGVDVVRLASGALPGPGEVLADVQNANVGVYDGRAGDIASVVGAGGLARSRGEGRSIPGGEEVQDENVIVLYATSDTIAALGGERGYDRLAIRLRDTSRGPETVESVRRYLETVPGFAGFRGLPELRAPGDWPGKADTEAFAKFLSVITLLALLSALVLISNTMTTLVAEQTGEIGIMRAIGARRRQVGARLLEDRLAARCARRRSSAWCSESSSPTCLRATSARCSGRSTSASASTRPWWSRASPSACSRRRSRRCPRSGAASASTSGRRSSRPDPRSAARTQATGCSAVQASYRGRCRSDCAASAGGGVAASRRR